MRICTLACAAAIAAVPASAQELGLVIDLLPGHPIYHESEREAGVVMAISITPDQGNAADLKELCEELRVVAGLGRQNGEDLPLEVIFVVPYKGMAIEGYYLPADGTSGSEALVRGNSIARETLDGIVARAGIPSRILDETDVEHEVSCEINEPAWLIRWEDVRLVGGEEPDMVIGRAYRRFMTIHRSIVQHTMGTPPSADLLGSNRPLRSFVATKTAPAPGAVPQPAHLKPERTASEPDCSILFALPERVPLKPHPFVRPVTIKFSRSASRTRMAMVRLVSESAGSTELVEHALASFRSKVSGPR